MGFSLKHRSQEKNSLWAIAFSPEIFVDEEKPAATEKIQRISYQCFATCGGPRVSIYEYQSRKGDDRKVGETFCLRQSHRSSSKDEDFYALTFARRRCRFVAGQHNGREDEQHISRQVLCVGGACTGILILDVETGKLQATLNGSISYISDLKAISCPTGAQKVNLLCSATRDQVRIWNLDSLANVCIFAGDPDGHIGDVLSVAWHPTGSRIVSGGGEVEEIGMDEKKSKHGEGKRYQICIWNVLESKKLQEAIQASSYLPDFANDRSQVNPHIERFAASVHNDVHSNKVDCVAWLGDLVLSKSIFDEIILWQPIIHDESMSIDTDISSKSSIQPIRVFHYQRNDCFYFVRFALSLDFMLAVGNNVGQVYLWDVKDFDRDGHSQILKTSSPSSGKKKYHKPSSMIRGLAFSSDGELLVGCDANGGVYCWKKT